jgi:putative tryptophan/tyrosine transport system substrate-binding protein
LTSTGRGDTLRRTMTTRRAFLAAALALLTAPLVTHAQQAARRARVGLLDPSVRDPSREPLWDTFRQRLRELGYREGDNLLIEFRSAHGQADRLASAAAELARLNADVIVARSTPAALAARRVTTTIPIVLTNSADPVGAGLVESLARPGGNVTGVTTLTAELSAKRLEVLREIVPVAQRVAVLWDETNVGLAIAVRDTEVAAHSLGLQTVVFGARRADDIDRAVLAMTRQQVGACIVMPGPVFSVEQRRIVGLVATHRVPAAYTQREYVEAGGLVAYGSNLSDLFTRAADVVVKILKGAKPADLPVEQPTKFELVINLKTAKTLGLTIPPLLLLRADQVIEQ